MKLQELKEHDIRQICREATIKLAKVLNIEYPELRDNVELENIIKEKDENLLCLLNKFNQSYFNYFYFSKGVAAQNKRNDLSEKEITFLQEYISLKNAARKSLLEAMDKYIELYQ